MVTPKLPQSRHVDELVDVAVARPSDVIELFIRMVERLEDEPKLMGVLVWPLMASTELVTQIPTVDALNVSSDREPPSLYVLDRESRILYQAVEEYRKPLAPGDFGITRKDVRTYYRCFRVGEAISNNWEYLSAVYFEHYPSTLCI